MASIPTDNSDPNPTGGGRAPFTEPTISAPLDLAKSSGRGPMMAMLSGSGGGPAADGGFLFDGSPPGYLDGHADSGAGPGGVSDTNGAD